MHHHDTGIAGQTSDTKKLSVEIIIHSGLAARLIAPIGVLGVYALAAARLRRGGLVMIALSFFLKWRVTR